MRSWALAGWPASTATRLLFASHQPHADPSSGSNDTVNPSDSPNARSGASRCRCESPLSSSHGASSGACSARSFAFAYDAETVRELYAAAGRGERPA